MAIRCQTIVEIQRSCGLQSEFRACHEKSSESSIFRIGSLKLVGETSGNWPQDGDRSFFKSLATPAVPGLEEGEGVSAEGALVVVREDFEGGLAEASGLF